MVSKKEFTRHDFDRNQQILKIAERVIPEYLIIQAESMAEEEDEYFNGEMCFFTDTLNDLIDVGLEQKGLDKLNSRERDSLLMIHQSFIEERGWEILEVEKSSRTEHFDRDFVYCIHFYADEYDKLK